MATFTREQLGSTARRAANGRFTAARAALGRSTHWGLSRAEQAPFAAAVIASFAILAMLTILATVGSILSGILPQLGGGIAIGVLLGYLAMGRRPERRGPAGTTALAVRDEEDSIIRR